MPKKALSVTLDQDNLLWLQGQTRMAKRRSLSETLDTLITDARLAGRVPASSIRSVRGTISINEFDPELLTADDYVRSIFEESIQRPFLVRESVPAARPRRGKKRG